MANKYTFDIDAACRYAASHTQPKSIGKCATYVKNAMQAGGLPYVGGYNGSDMDRYCKMYGFKQLNLSLDGNKKNPIGAQKGDIMSVHHYYHGNGPDYGHTCIFDGYKWISDHKQNNCIPYNGGWWDVTFWRWTDNPQYSGYDPNIPIISADNYQGGNSNAGEPQYRTITGSGKGNIFENADENAFTIASVKTDIKIQDNKTRTRIYSTNDATIVLDELALPMEQPTDTSTSQEQNNESV